jgi:hypothetical protein
MHCYGITGMPRKALPVTMQQCIPEWRMENALVVWRKQECDRALLNSSSNPLTEWKGARRAGVKCARTEVFCRIRIAPERSPRTIDGSTSPSEARRREARLTCAGEFHTDWSAQQIASYLELCDAPLGGNLELLSLVHRLVPAPARYQTSLDSSLVHSFLETEIVLVLLLVLDVVFLVLVPEN